MKNVTNAGSSVSNQLSRAKKKWVKLGNPGSARVVITMVDCSDSFESVIESVSARGGYKEVLVVSDKKMRRIKK